MRSRVALLAILAAGHAYGAAKIEFLCKQMKTAKDPRLRVQAALGLGSTNDIDAIPCLCDGLNDGSGFVRASVARAHRALADQKSLECLAKHLNDADREARAEIKAAFDLIDGQNVKSGIGNVYVWLVPTLDKGPGAANARLCDERLRAALSAKGVQVAPAGQSRDQAVSTVKSQHLKGFEVRPELHSASGNGLELQLFGIQLKNAELLGEVGVTARGPAPPKLIGALAPKIVDEAADAWNWSH